ncbi:MAG TPA: TonB-dependent receptor [Vicinamibacterales bacterium]|nr:TonB-dependent receptor [Vicinamibacterales bacterium]
MSWRFLRASCLALLLASLGLALPALAAAQSTAANADRTGGVRGRIVDPDGLPVPNVPVTLRRVLSGTPTLVGTTADGTFTAGNLTPGFYEITASLTGLTLDPQRVRVEAGRVLDAGSLRLSLAGAHEDVIVSASRVTELEDDAPTKVLAVTKDEIAHTGYERVGDVLADVPGIVTRAQSYGAGLTSGEQIDGIDSKETLVLLDGLPIVGARGINEGFIDLNQQSVGPIERVEVVKGAASSLYGTDALGGVINLVSRQPSAPIDVDATLSGGTLGVVDSRAGIGARRGGLSAFLDVEHHQRDGYTLLPGSDSTVGADEHRHDVMAKARYAFNSRAALGFTGTFYDTHQLGRSTATLPDPSQPFAFTSFPATLHAQNRARTAAVTGDFTLTSSTTLQTRAYVSGYDENSDSRPFTNGVEGAAFDIGTLHERYRRGDATLSQQLGRWQFVQVGYEGVYDQYRGDNRIVGADAGQSLSTNDVWVQDRIQPGRAVVLTVGGRYQHNSTFGGHFVPKAGVVYRMGEHVTLRGAAGLGFRAPNLGELYYHLLHLEYGYQVIGNPTLQSETSRSYSGGATFDKGRYRASVNVFRHDLRNLINSVSVCDATQGEDCSGASLDAIMADYGVPPSFGYDSSGGAFFTFVNLNVDRARTAGFDVDGRVALTPVFDLSGAYTYLHAEDVTTDIWLPYRSRHQGYVKLQFSRPSIGLLANVRGTFFSRWPTQASADPVEADFAYGYEIWSIYASKTVGGGLRAFAAVDNLANSRDKKLDAAQPTFDRPDYGRTLRVGVQFNFRSR